MPSYEQYFPYGSQILWRIRKLVRVSAYMEQIKLVVVVEVGDGDGTQSEGDCLAEGCVREAQGRQLKMLGCWDKQEGIP